MKIISNRFLAKINYYLNLILHRNLKILHKFSRRELITLFLYQKSFGILKHEDDKILRDRKKPRRGSRPNTETHFHTFNDKKIKICKKKLR